MLRSGEGRSAPFESRAESKLMRISVDGGKPQPIPGADAQTRGAVWGPDDVIVYATRNGLWRMPVAGGKPKPIFEGGESVVGTFLLVIFLCVIR